MADIVFTSITKPVGIDCDDLTRFSSSEHIYTHLMMEQDIFGARAQVDHWPLDLIAYNLHAPSVVLHWPSMGQLLSEIKYSNPKYVAIPVVSATFERAENMAGRIREINPKVKIVYGGFPPEKGSADKLIIGEGVSGFRDFLGEEQREINHPLIFLDYKILNIPLSSSQGIILEKVGCDNRCDFCSTSHYHNGARYLVDEAQVNALLSQYLSKGSNSITIFNEDHLRDKERNSRIHSHVKSLDELLKIMCFSCMDSIQQYNVEELFDLGYHNIWVGFEDFSSKYAKNDYSKAKEFVETMHQHGILLIVSGFIGSPEQTMEDCNATIDKIIGFRAYTNQFGIKTPFIGTPFHQQVQIADERHKNYDGRHLVHYHPSISKKEMEELQIHAQKRDYYELGPSIIRALGIMFQGYKTFKSTDSPRIKRRVAEISARLRKSLPLFDLAVKRHPNPEVREKTKELKSKIVSELGMPRLYYLNSFAVNCFGLYKAGRLYAEKRFPSLMRQPKFKRNVYNNF